MLSHAYSGMECMCREGTSTWVMKTTWHINMAREGSQGLFIDGPESTEDLCRQAKGRAHFEVGDLVFLRLQPYIQSSLKKSGAEKD
jgi:hypothetical protein